MKRFFKERMLHEYGSKLTKNRVYFAHIFGGALSFNSTRGSIHLLVCIGIAVIGWKEAFQRCMWMSIFRKIFRNFLLTFMSSKYHQVWIYPPIIEGSVLSFEALWYVIWLSQATLRHGLYMHSTLPSLIVGGSITEFSFFPPTSIY